MFAAPMMMKAAASGVATPLVIFGSALTGWWEADIATLYQDAAGTTPVTATGQTVSRINDKSGSGQHLIITAGAPLYQVDGDGDPYISLDGSSWYDTAATNAWVTDAGYGAFFAGSVDNFSTYRSILDTDNGSGAGRVAQLIRFEQTGGNAATIMFSTSGTAKNDQAGAASAGVKLTAFGTAGSGLVEAFLNNASDGSTIYTGSIRTNSQKLRLGARLATSQPFVGRFHGAFMVNRQPTPGERSLAQTYLGTLI